METNAEGRLARDEREVRVRRRQGLALLLAGLLLLEASSAHAALPNDIVPTVTSTTDRVMCGMESTLLRSLDQANRATEGERRLYLKVKGDAADLQKQVDAYKNLANTPAPVQVEKPDWLWPVVGGAGVVGIAIGVAISIVVIEKTK